MKDFNYCWAVAIYYVIVFTCYYTVLVIFKQMFLCLWIRTCLQYAVPSVVSGLRLLLICEVALGECCDLTSIHTDLTAPPSGFHSCHGVKLTEDTLTDFVVHVILMTDILLKTHTNTMNMQSFLKLWEKSCLCIHFHKGRLQDFYFSTTSELYDFRKLKCMYNLYNEHVWKHTLREIHLWF